MELSILSDSLHRPPQQPKLNVPLTRTTHQLFYCICQGRHVCICRPQISSSLAQKSSKNPSFYYVCTSKLCAHVSSTKELAHVNPTLVLPFDSCGAGKGSSGPFSPYSTTRRNLTARKRQVMLLYSATTSYRPPRHPVHPPAFDMCAELGMGTGRSSLIYQ